MAVNYTMQNVPVSLVPNSDWWAQDVTVPELAGLFSVPQNGVADGGAIGLRMVIIPNDGYVVSSEDFTIGGVEPSSSGSTVWPSTGAGENVDIPPVGPVRWWNNINPPEPYDLPDGVEIVYMYDSAVPGTPENMVVVTAKLDSYYEIGTENITITLNIDGDAQVYTPPQSLNQFTISVELANPTPNAKVFSVIPNGTNSAYNLFPYSWLITPVDPTDDLTKASVLCTWPYQTGQSNAQLQWPGTTSHNQAWFWIIPNEGYTISRHNFYPSNATISSPSNPLTGTIGFVAITGSWTQAWLSGANLSDYPETSQLFGVGQFNGNTLTSGQFPYIGYGNSDQANLYLNYGGASTNASAVYGGQNGIYSSNSNDYGSNQLLLIDTNEDSLPAQSFDDSIYPYNILNTELTNGVLPDNLCASDWNKNAVLVVLNGISSHTPGDNPVNITLELEGQAMLDDGSNCVDSEIEIIPDCIDGFDENGNPC